MGLETLSRCPQLKCRRFQSLPCGFIRFHYTTTSRFGNLLWCIILLCSHLRGAGMNFPLARHGCCPWVFPIFSSHFWGVLCNLGHQDQWSKSLSAFEHCRLRLLFFPFLFSRFWAALPFFVHTSGHTWSGLAVVSIFVNLHPNHKYPFGCSLTIEWILWILSKNLTNACSNRHSSNRQCVFLAWRPDQYE